MKCKKIFLVNAGEPLPIEGNKPHRMSHWMKKLTEIGHDVIFFTTDFEHQRKMPLSNLIVPNGYRLLNSKVSYSKNISFRRLVNHYFLGRSLKMALMNSEKPDIIICSYPTIGMSHAVTRYGKENNIPVIIDVRDLWPDIFISPILGKFFLFPLFCQKRYIFKNATAIIGVSPNYVKWANSGQSFAGNILPLAQYEITQRDPDVVNIMNPLKLIFVGTLGDTYDLALISRISRLLSLKNINHQIRICGDGPQRNSVLESISDQSEVSYLGWLSRDDLDQELRRSHIGLMLYKKSSPQGWPNKLIEYMSYGMPVVNTLPGESWDLIQETHVGINIDRDNLESLADWIINEIVPNYLLNSKNVLKIFEDNFNEEIVFKKLIKIIEDVTTNS